MGNVLIVAEQKNGKLRSATLNAITFGKEMLQAQGGGDLLLLVMGQGAGAAAAAAAKYGATKVLTAENAAFEPYMAEVWAPAVAQVARDNGAAAVGATATAFGKDLLPRVAALLDVGMVTEVVEVTGPKTFKRPLAAGNAIALVEVTTDLFVATCRQTEFDAAPEGGDAPVEVVTPTPGDALGAVVDRIEAVENARPDLAEAKVVVSGGRGMKSAENFKHLEQLTDLFGGALGATRAACDAGMVANDLQVGQTGKVVAPDLYIAVGISGAIQHLAGMKSSKVIVAINKDEEAPIFQVADYGLVAKWEDTLPDFIAKVQSIRGA